MRNDEELMRQNPEYHKYYYTHKNINPRLPPPIFNGGWQNWQYPQFLNTPSNVNNNVNNMMMMNNNISHLDFNENGSTNLTEHKDGNYEGENKTKKLIHAPKPQKDPSSQSSSWNFDEPLLGENRSLSNSNSNLSNLLNNSNSNNNTKGVRAINQDFPRTSSPIYNPLSNSYNKLNLVDHLSPSTIGLPIRKTSPNPTLSGSSSSNNLSSFNNPINTGLNYSLSSLSSQMEHMSLNNNHPNSSTNINGSNPILGSSFNENPLSEMNSSSQKVNYPLGSYFMMGNSHNINPYANSYTPSPLESSMGKESPKPITTNNSFSSLVPTQDSYFPSSSSSSSSQEWGFDDNFQNRGYRNGNNVLVSPMGGRGMQGVSVQPPRTYNNNLPNNNVDKKVNYVGGRNSKPRNTHLISAPVPQSTRSSLLEEFRTNKNKRFEIKVNFFLNFILFWFFVLFSYFFFFF
jgi:hypothetical protein